MPIPPEQLPEVGITFPLHETNHGKGQNPVSSGVLQLTVSCFQTQQKVVIHLGPQYLKLIIKDQNLQNGNIRIDQAFPSKRSVGHFIRLQQCLHSDPR